MEKRIENAIKQLKLKQEDIDIISYVNMKTICKLAKVNMVDLMYYLRYEREV